MSDILYTIYPWVKAGHILAVISWMAGMLYLPRLFVHHIESAPFGSDTDVLLQKMELKLLKVIINPAMIATWVFGLTMAMTPGIIDWGSGWPWVKLGCVLVLSWFHGYLSKRRKEFVAGTVKLTGKQFRLLNEVPTVLMILIVIMVIVRPF